MKKNLFSNIFTAIDIGTTKICVLIGKKNIQGIEIIGIGRAPSHGLEKGIVVDMEKTVYSLTQAVNEAQTMAGCTIESATIGVSGSHIKSFNSHGIVPIKSGYVCQSDINHVIATSKAIAIPEGQQILHVLPQYFIIDERERTLNPLGMFGVRLESHVHIITGAIASVQNLVKCCELANIAVSDIVLEQIASAKAVLTDDERFLGIGILDIGGGTSDFIVYKNKSVLYTTVFPVAGNQFTRDIAIGLRTTLQEAERIKKNFDFLLDDQMKDNFLINCIGNVQTHTISHQELKNIIYPRAEELLLILKDTLIKNNLYQAMTAGLVLTGGGSLLSGFADVSKHILKIPIRIGNPLLEISELLSLDNPMYATGYGLLLQSFKNSDTATSKTFSSPLLLNIVDRMRTWVSDLF